MTDTTETANLLARHFIARPDVKAVQHADGSWAPDRTKFTRADLVAHLEGRRTFGHYLLNPASETKIFCYDIDVNKTGDWFDGLGDPITMNPREAIRDPNHSAHKWLVHQVRCMAQGLSIAVERLLKIKTVITWTGGKGAHVYGLISDQRVPAAEARAAARWILDDYGVFEAVRGDCFFQHTFRDDPRNGYPHVTLEVFPKQDTLDGKDLGNLLRLPLGVNRKTNEESFFMDPNAPDGVLSVLDPAVALTGMLWPPKAAA